jgi:hypothetical protein
MRIALLCSSVFLALTSLAWTTDRTFTVEPDPSDLRIEEVEGFHRIHWDGFDLTSRPGEPELPVKPIWVALEPHERVTGIRIEDVRWRDLEGSYLVRSGQPPAILSNSSPKLVDPDPFVYAERTPYPENVLELGETGLLAGQHLACLLLYPIRYIPGEGRLAIVESLDFELEIEPGDPGLRTRAPSGALRKALLDLVVNPESLREPMAPPRDDGGFEYLIVTDEAYVTAFQPMADWKTKKGVPAEIRSMSWISSTMSGQDDAEKLRNYIRVCHQDSGLAWVLLGGDTDVVPDRVGYAMTCEAGMYWDEDSLRADLYYSDLDGSWNADGDAVFGEVEDSVDLFPDVFVGRAPVNTLTEAETFVTKVVRYERTAPADYQTDALLFAEVLWSSPLTDAGLMKDMIGDMMPPGFDTLKLYETRGNESPSSVIAAMNAGKNIQNHAGHGNTTVMGAGTGYLDRSDMDNLTNGDRQGILYSIGCWVGAFHYDAISEHFINNPNGGGVAFVCNSSYGWGSPGNPGYGYSDRFDLKIHEFYLGGCTQIGAALAMTKAHFIPRSRDENVYRWHQYQLNLLGDPEMPVWTGAPHEFTVSHPESLPVGTSALHVIVTESGNPVEGARVCLMKDSEVYETALTGPAGEASFTVHPTSPGNLHVTVTGQNFMPHEGTAQVYTALAHVGLCSISVIDTISGNGDLDLNPGETAYLRVTLGNFGSSPAVDVSATLRSTDPLLDVTDSTATFGTLGAGDSASAGDGFAVELDPTAQNGDAFYLNLEISVGGAPFSTEPIALLAKAPLLSVCDAHASDRPDPGDTISLTVNVENTGLGAAYLAYALLNTADPWIGLPGADSIFFGDIPAGDTSASSLTISVDPSCPVPHFARIDLSIRTEDGTEFDDSLNVTIGETGISDDMESGPGDWDAQSLWHLTTHNAHSGEYSWYCGNEGTWSYDNNMNAPLTSPPIVLGPHSYLSFWQWNEVTIYGVDGLYVEVGHGGDFDTLDFIGSGGALLPIGNDWLEEVYDLSSYPEGDTVYVRFRFASDNSDTEEGFYIDDLHVGSGLGVNLPPSPFSLLSPLPGDSTGYPVPLDWEDAFDPNPLDEVTYTLVLSLNPDLSDSTEIGGIEGSEYTLFPEEPETIYHWRVRAVDGRGGMRLSTETFHFYTSGPAPHLSYLTYYADDGAGGNGAVEPGETCDLDVTLRNDGYRLAQGVHAVLTDLSGHIDVLVDSAEFSDVPVGGTGTSITPYNIYVHSDCPVPHLAEMRLDIGASGRFAAVDTFHLLIGPSGFLSDVEDTTAFSHGSGTGGYSDEWHWSTERSHSATHSWKCGTVGGTYSASLDACLETQEFLLGPSSVLTFYHWMEAETSGYYSGECYDAGIVQIQVDGGEWTNIAPVGGYPYLIRSGSGHPFPGQMGYSGVFGWTQATFDLTGYTGLARLRFRFGSDQAVSEEGWYVDDVTVQSVPQADIDLDPWSFCVDLMEGEDSVCVLTVFNVGGEDLAFDIDVQTDPALLGFSGSRRVGSGSLARESWLSVSPEADTVAEGSSVEVQVTLDASGLGQGTHTGTLEINSNDPDESWLQVPISLTVTSGICGDANGDLSVTPGDGYLVLNYLGAGPTPVSCWAANVDGSDGISPADGYHLLNYLGAGPGLDCAPCEFALSRRPAPIRGGRREAERR